MYIHFSVSLPYIELIILVVFRITITGDENALTNLMKTKNSQGCFTHELIYKFEWGGFLKAIEFII